MTRAPRVAGIFALAFALFALGGCAGFAGFADLGRAFARPRVFLAMATTCSLR